MAKVRVGLLYGGRSVEHEVSLVSANSILHHLDPSRYEVWPIAVTHDGAWRAGKPGDALERAMDFGESLANPTFRDDDGLPLDVIFPIIHGHGGEDGTLQGLLELAELPYVGSGVLGSSLQMDKDLSRRVLERAGLPLCPWLRVDKHEISSDPRGVAARVVAELGLPVFVKPANSGSSVGIHKVEAAKALGRALAEASRYDTKLVVERALAAREIEVAILGNHAPEASLPGEIRSSRDWYDYEAKYVDEGTDLLIPAPLAADQVAALKDMAIRAFHALDGAGLARVDFFLEKASGHFFINEVNSLPGFTEVSMYPKMWEASGLPYPQLLDRLIELAFERHRERASLETTLRRG